MASKERGESNSSVMGYFRKIFTDRPDLLNTRSNDEVTRLWLLDHPEHTELPKSVRNSLANLKSLMRKKLRQNRLQMARMNHSDGKNHQHPVKSLEVLESQIDDALTLARLLNREDLAHVVKLLHRARNEVVWKLGQ